MRCNSLLDQLLLRRSQLLPSALDEPGKGHSLPSLSPKHVEKCVLSPWKEGSGQHSGLSRKGDGSVPLALPISKD